MHADPAAEGKDGAGHLAVTGIAHDFADRRVLNDISFTARAGDRIGVIGENGTGKSTLLGIIAGQLEPSSGTVTHPGSVGLLTQELSYPDETPLARVLDDAQKPALTVLSTIEQLGSQLADHPEDPAIASAYGTALELAEHSGAWSAEAHRGDVVSGLGLGGFSELHPIGELSGGQRLRLALAAILLAAPHTLLLDEPSNHLDDASAAYLERVLRDWPGIVIVASHDRALLDSITTRILDLDPLPVPARELADAILPPADSTTGVPASAHAPTGISTRTRTRAHTTNASANTNTNNLTTSSNEETDDPGSGFGMRLWGVGYSAARAERRAELTRWRNRYAAESTEIAALVHEIEVGSREVNRKHESKSESRITRKFYADKDARVTSRRARNARVRLESLERDRVRRPPEPLRFAGFAPTTPDTDATDAPGAPDPSNVTGLASGIDATRAATAASTTDATSTKPNTNTNTNTNTITPNTHNAEDAANAASTPQLRADRVALGNRLAPTSLEIFAGDRLLLAGPNGTGKSTLLAILAGELAPDAGTVSREASVGYLPQELPLAPPDRTALAHYRATVGADLADTIPLAATGLLAARDLARKVGELSVGQRRRLALAALVARPPSVLLLDEPTNHLSLTLVEELEEALRGFRGALVIATHDRWFRAQWTDSVLTIGGSMADQ